MPELQNFEAYFAGKTLTTDWTSRNYRLWADILSARRDEPLRVLEIGSWEGRSALFFLNYLPRATIVCVDTFTGGVEHQAWPFWRRMIQLRAIEKRFDSNTVPFSDRIQKIKEHSLTALGRLGIEGQRFELVYIDGSHLAIDVYRDGIMAWPLITPAGILIFDDYQRRVEPEAERPHVGIDAFLSATAGSYEELFRGHQVILRKR